MKKLFLGSLSRGGKEQQEATKKKFEEFLSGLEAEQGPLKKLDLASLVQLIHILVFRLIRERERYEETAERERIMSQAIDISASIDANRIHNRQDQVDMRAFQEAVITNIDVYPTIAAAIKDLRIKPQFENYADGTLRTWATEVWPTEKKAQKKEK